MLTPEQRQQAAQTRKANQQARQERQDALRNDKEQAIKICRKIRDDENSSATDKLTAITLLKELTA